MTKYLRQLTFLKHEKGENDHKILLLHIFKAKTHGVRELDSQAWVAISGIHKVTKK